jgi:hypothetical protein
MLRSLGYLSLRSKGLISLIKGAFLYKGRP